MSSKKHRAVVACTGLVCAVFLFAEDALGQGMHWRPGADQVAALEKGLVLPPGAGKLNSYARHYWGENTPGGKLIRGEFLGGMPASGTYISTIAVLPAPGGGCKFLDVSFVVATGKSSVKCHDKG